MLKAVLQGKAGRLGQSGEDDHSWRDLFKLREDLLTAAFFGRIQYLSEVGEKAVLALLTPPRLTSDIGSIRRVSFWPKLRGEKGRAYVEPDVILECDRALLIVEVKPPFGGKQSPQQWASELRSLLAQKELEGSEWEVPDIVCFLALGRNSKHWENMARSLENDLAEFDESIHVHAMEWESLCEGISSLADAQNGRDHHVYNDWKDAFSLFGLVDRPKPFADLLKLRTTPLSVLKWDLYTKLSLKIGSDRSWHIDDPEWTILDGLSKRLNLNIGLWK